MTKDDFGLVLDKPIQRPLAVCKPTKEALDHTTKSLSRVVVIFLKCLAPHQPLLVEQDLVPNLVPSSA